MRQIVRIQISRNRRKQNEVADKNMNTEFKRPVLEDRDVIMHYFSLQKSRSCECTFSCVYLWSRFYYVEYAILEDMMVFKCGKGNTGAV